MTRQKSVYYDVDTRAYIYWVAWQPVSHNYIVLEHFVFRKPAEPTPSMLPKLVHNSINDLSKYHRDDVTSKPPIIALPTDVILAASKPSRLLPDIGAKPILATILNEIKELHEQFEALRDFQKGAIQTLQERLNHVSNICGCTLLPSKRHNYGVSNSSNHITTASR